MLSWVEASVVPGVVVVVVVVASAHGQMFPFLDFVHHESVSTEKGRKNYQNGKKH